ncbi:MAG TPA: V-type ATP synthase subunit I [Candidatus Nanoarchaeia archaeon]|nr:V-type ATP synthase subunit I [Candidatus Nanoarchaeia archaeon]
MLRPEEMSKITVMGPKSLSYKIIDKLHKMKVYHIVDHKKTEELDIGSPLGNSEAISEILVKIRAISSLLGIDLEKNRVSKKAPQERIDLASAKSRVDKLSESAISKTTRLKEIDEKIRHLDERRAVIKNIALLKLSPDSFRQYGSIDYLFGFIDDIKDLAEDLKTAKGKCKGCSASIDGKSVIAIFFDKRLKQEISEKLSRRGFAEIDTSFIGAEGLKGDASKEIMRLASEIGSLSSQASSLKKEIGKTKTEWSDYLASTEQALSIEAEKAEAPLRFGATESTFIIRGWAPSKNIQEVTKELNLASKQKVFITTEIVKEGDEIPIKLKNPNIVRPFEWFMDLYTLPSYKEIDPTFLMFLTFPLFYGFMLGDVGYGFVTLILFLVLRAKIKGDFGRLINAMIFGSISSIIFGVLFAEYFGFELYHPILINRMHDTEGLLIMAVAIGAVHINIGLLVGFYNELRSHGFATAVFEKLSWLMLEAGVAIIALSYTDLLTLRPERWVGFVILAVSIFMIYKGEGAKGLIEIPALFSHMLSYARLMAVGLASVILAAVINDLAGEMFAAGIAGIIGGVLLLAVGHSVNIGLGLISPFLHSLRLHYVEFFTKFYHGGGIRYIPFGAEREMEQ